MNPLDELEVKMAGIRIRVPPYFRINERGHREDVKGYTRTLRIGDPGGIDDDLTPYERRALANVDPSQVAMIDKIRRNASALKSMGPLERLEVKADVNPFEPDVSQGLPATPDEANTVSKFLSPEQQWGAQTPTPSAIDRLIDQAQVVEVAPWAFRPPWPKIGAAGEQIPGGPPGMDEAGNVIDPARFEAWRAEHGGDLIDDGSQAIQVELPSGYKATLYPGPGMDESGQITDPHRYWPWANENRRVIYGEDENGTPIDDDWWEVGWGGDPPPLPEKSLREPGALEATVESLREKFDRLVDQLLAEFEIPDTPKNRLDMKEQVDRWGADSLRRKLLAIHGPAGARKRVIYGGGPNTLRSP